MHIEVKIKFRSAEMVQIKQREREMKKGPILDQWEIFTYLVFFVEE